LVLPEYVSERVILEDERVLLIHPAPVVLGDEFLGTVSIFRDITREVEVDRLKSEFVATVSHELRTPMTSIKGFVDLLLMGATGALNPEQRRFLDIVKNNTERLEILVNDLLDISRIEAGKVTLSFQPIDVRELLHEAELFIERRREETGKKIDLVIEASPDLPQVWGDPERVRQILNNLVENAFNYTPEGGQITLRAEMAQDQVEIEVRDNGIGISLSEQARIFERFYRGEQALIMGVGGTGLGLAIVLNLVEMHGGRIWVNSEGIPGRGTTFTLALPIASKEALSTTPWEAG
jgi:signal transduction histidine kinase